MTHRIGFLLIPGFHLLDLSGPLSVFQDANERDEAFYDLQVVSPQGGLVESEIGLAVLSSPLDGAALDTLVLVGGRGPRLAASSPDTVTLVADIASSAKRVASICTGAFPLAATGLLDGRRVTTHWAHSAALQRQFPALQVEADHIFVEDGPFWSSAGITAGIDLALALVERDQGRDIARRVARTLVVYHRRPGSQSQISTMLDMEPASDRLRRAWSFARDHLHEPLPVERLAEAASLSPRQFGRAFRAETGQSPAKAVERLRVEAACAHLENGRESLERIATAVGFSSAEHMRRAFLRVMGQPPQMLKREARAKRPPAMF